MQYNGFQGLLLQQLVMSEVLTISLYVEAHIYYDLLCLMSLAKSNLYD